jgi:hypothetical protein
MHRCCEFPTERTSDPQEFLTEVEGTVLDAHRFGGGSVNA